MSSAKLLTFLSHEWLPKTGDATKLLVKYSITDAEVEPGPDEKARTQDYDAVLTLAGSAETMWISRNPDLEETANLRKALLEHLRSNIKNALEHRRQLPSGDIRITSDQNPSPPAFGMQIQLGKPERINVKRRLGF
jgi:hypothetical protein